MQDGKAYLIKRYVPLRLSIWPVLTTNKAKADDLPAGALSWIQMRRIPASCWLRSGAPDWEYVARQMWES